MDYTFVSLCIDKIVAEYRGVANNIACPNAPSQTLVLSNPNCSACLRGASNVYTDANCIQCWLDFNYAYGRCGAAGSSGLSFYAS
jgi:predicted amidophosphoribosyltransferase